MHCSMLIKWILNRFVSDGYWGKLTLSRNKHDTISKKSTHKTSGIHAHNQLEIEIEINELKLDELKDTICIGRSLMMSALSDVASGNVVSVCVLVIYQLPVSVCVSPSVLCVWMQKLVENNPSTSRTSNVEVKSSRSNSEMQQIAWVVTLTAWKRCWRRSASELWLLVPVLVTCHTVTGRVLVMVLTAACLTSVPTIMSVM